MRRAPIYTVGYGNRTIEEFVELLRYFEIDYVVDVRSATHLRHCPHFSKDALKKQLQHYTIHYVFMGDALGSHPDDTTCYLNNKVDYAIVRTKFFYLQGIDRLCTAWEKQLRIAVMCAEARPQECHRSILIGNTLAENHIDVAHIDEMGCIKEQRTINQLLTGEQNTGQLPFFEETALTFTKKRTVSHSSYSDARNPFPF